MTSSLVRSLLLLSAFGSVLGSERVDENEAEMPSASALPCTSEGLETFVLTNPTSDGEASFGYPADPVIQAEIVSTYEIIRENEDSNSPNALNQLARNRRRRIKDMCYSAAEALYSAISSINVADFASAFGHVSYPADMPESTRYDESRFEYLESVPTDLHAEDDAVNVDLPPIEEASATVS